MRTRTPIDWPPILVHVAAHPEESQSSVAARFGLPLGTLKAKLARERATAPTPGVDPAHAAAVYVPIAELVPWVRNPRRH